MALVPTRGRENGPLELKSGVSDSEFHFSKQKMSLQNLITVVG